MDALTVKGLIWSALTGAGLDVTPASYVDHPEVRGLLVTLEDGKQLIVLVGELNAKPVEWRG